VKATKQSPHSLFEFFIIHPLTKPQTANNKNPSPANGSTSFILNEIEGLTIKSGEGVLFLKL